MGGGLASTSFPAWRPGSVRPRRRCSASARAALPSAQGRESSPGMISDRMRPDVCSEGTNRSIVP